MSPSRRSRRRCAGWRWAWSGAKENKRAPAGETGRSMTGLRQKWPSPWQSFSWRPSSLAPLGCASAKPEAAKTPDASKLVEQVHRHCAGNLFVRGAAAICGQVGAAPCSHKSFGVARVYASAPPQGVEAAGNQETIVGPCQRNKPPVEGCNRFVECSPQVFTARSMPAPAARTGVGARDRQPFPHASTQAATRMS